MKNPEDLIKELEFKESLSENFELKVFEKIKKRKSIKKKSKILFVFVSIVSLVILSLIFNIRAVRENNQQNFAKKEVIPIMDNVILSTNSATTHYAMEIDNKSKARRPL